MVQEGVDCLLLSNLDQPAVTSGLQEVPRQLARRPGWGGRPAPVENGFLMLSICLLGDE